MMIVDSQSGQSVKSTEKEGNAATTERSGGVDEGETGLSVGDRQGAKAIAEAMGEGARSGGATAVYPKGFIVLPKRWVAESRRGRSRGCTGTGG